MADLLSALLAFPPEHRVSSEGYDGHIQDYLTYLTKLPSSTWSKPINKQNILDLLNPAVNTLPYLIGLNSQATAAGKDRARIEDAITRSFTFFTSFDPLQVRYAGEQWLRLVGWATDIWPKLGVRDFSPLSTGMLRLDPSAGTFTSVHLLFLRMCLDSGVPTQALPILDKNIYAFPQLPPKNLPDDYLCDEHLLSNGWLSTKSGHTHSLKPEYILEYYLAGALVYIGTRNWARARLFLEYILLTPSSQHGTSALQAEAYKKWVLVGLLSQGRSFPLPRTHDQQVFKTLKAVGKAYDSLAETFKNRDWQKFQAEMDTGTQLWHDDGNLRLVKEAGDALRRYRVIDLQKTFAALPVSRVAAHLELSPYSTQHMLNDMISQSYLHATITPATSSGDAVLTFLPAPEPPSNLEEQAHDIEALIIFVKDADRRLQLSKEFIDVQRRQKRGGAGPDGELAEQMDLSWDPPKGMMGEGDDEEMDEEDIMS